MKEVVIVSACRTPIGRFLGAFRDLSAMDLGTVVVREAIRRSGFSVNEIDEVIMGNVLQAGLGQNPARQAALRAGLPPSVAAMTINKVCGSGLKAVTLAAQAIQTGDAEVVVAGGMESMTNAPYLIANARKGLRMGNSELVDSMIHDGLWDAYENYHMGCTGEVVASRYGISRREQDEYALESHRKAVRAIEEGNFADEIVSVEVRRGAERLQIDTDEGPRKDSSLEALEGLKPVFQDNGTVTAGNASQLSDGASALVVASREAAKAHNLVAKARIVASATSGIEPELVMMAPVDAVSKVLKRAGWEKQEVDLFELNEAFAVQSVALCREIPLDPSRVNVNGGAVALGHPIGASGARILTTLLHALEKRDQARGVASLCLGGGNAVALAIERI
ncbi:MAG TPA: acetyl-CoA C-acetyltransferase [Acidobacteriota bacterium]|nr:acetyl-CoA C-acetyltransferase [Acidobacteriota bacterium]